MAYQPQYVATPRTALVQLPATAAAGIRDGATTAVGTAVMSAAASGTRIDDIVIQATGTVPTGMIRFFIYDGTNSRLIEEVPVETTTVNATTEAWTTKLTNLAWILVGTSYSLRATTETANAFNIYVSKAGDF